MELGREGAVEAGSGSSDATPVPAADAGVQLKSAEDRKAMLARAVSNEVRQGYRVESQGETEAVLFTRGRRTWFGLFAGPGEGGRQMIGVDDQGAATTRKLTADETGESDEARKSRAS